MDKGPRDWSPPGYWDEPAAPPRSPVMRTATLHNSRRVPKQGRLWGLVAVMLGLFACVLPLSVDAVGSGFCGFAMTSGGITAVFLALGAGRAGHRILATLGLLLGLIGTILCGWSVAAFQMPAVVPPLPSISSLTAPGPPELPLVPTVGAAIAPRVVDPIDGANIAAEPTGQLRANLRHVVFELGVGLSAAQQYSTLPAELLFQADGTVFYGNATFSKVPAYMVVDYQLSGDGRDFTLRVRDAESGIAVSTDSVTRAVVNE